MASLKKYLLLLSVMVIGCSSVSEMRRIDQFEQIAHNYELAIRWSDFESASVFLEDQENPALPAQIEHLKQFQITSYEVRQFLPSKDKSQVIVFANLQYFKKSGLIVKNYSHRQLWKYNPEKENWFLASGLPDLK